MTDDADEPLLLQPVPPALSYATPTGYETPGLIWRDADRVAVTTGPVRYIRLPPRCVKCNTAGDDLRSWRRDLYWHPPAYFFLVIPGLLLYAIVALSVRTKVVVEGCLCATHRRQRRRRTRIGWAIAGLGVVLMPVAFYFVVDQAWQHTDWGPICFLSGLAVCLIAGV